MKKILFIALILFTSCKKDKPEPSKQCGVVVTYNKIIDTDLISLVVDFPKGRTSVGTFPIEDTTKYVRGSEWCDNVLHKYTK